MSGPPHAAVIDGSVALRDRRGMNACAAVLLLLGGAVPALAQSGVRLTRVPERVVLPAAAGENLVLEVEAPAAAEVWLARAADAADRVPLVATGGPTWQLNLADVRVLRLLAAGQDHGELFAFARCDGRTVASPAIGWARAAVTTKLGCLLVFTDGSRRQLAAEGEPWLDPAALERIEVRGAGAPQARVIAHAEHVVLPLVRMDDTFVLAMNDALRRDLARAGELGLEVQLGAAAQWLPFRIVPDRLAPEQPEFVVQQRHDAVIPGSRGWLEVRLDDITMGQVLLSVVDATGHTVVGPRSVHERDHVVLPFAGGDSVLVIDRLVNLLIGDDYAQLRVVEAAKFRPDPFAIFLQRIGAAEGVRFVREGVEWDSHSAEQFLRARLAAQRDPQLTLAGFVELAGRSSRTGEPYHVKRPDGEVVEAAVWFREVAAAVERDAAAAAKGAQGTGAPPAARPTGRQ